ncbi:YtxH domain-containing protein [Clostridium bovifaecis]|uniref:YtxH domain-containing protein n=1 Tax=Clostridium bovifaecis TaxID=2184719 RepID=A0A6I6F5Q8_9CLOT|nr:YtxH domain-containing protein [Clostridium bovifaecis]
MNGFVKGLTTGAVIGATAGMMMVPGMDRKTRKRLMRGRKTAMHKAENMMDMMMNWIS